MITNCKSIILAPSTWVLLIAVLLLGEMWWHHHIHTPEYTLDIFNNISTPEDLQRHKDYLTPQGAKIVSYVLENAKVRSRSHIHVDAPIEHGSKCFVPWRDDEDGSEGYIELIDNGYWQFNDYVINKLGKRELNMSFAYLVDHPILAQFKYLDWQELFDDFMTGFMLGLKLRGG